jgi:hypothetical protein
VCLKDWGMEIEYCVTGADGRSAAGAVRTTLHELGK